LRKARFSLAAAASSFPLILKDDGEDTAGKSNGNRIGADEGPRRRRQTICEPQRNAAGEHHIHRQGQSVCPARADNISTFMKSGLMKSEGDIVFNPIVAEWLTVSFYASFMTKQ